MMMTMTLRVLPLCIHVEIDYSLLTTRLSCFWHYGGLLHERPSLLDLVSHLYWVIVMWTMVLGGVLTPLAHMLIIHLVYHYFIAW